MSEARNERKELNTTDLLSCPFCGGKMLAEFDFIGKFEEPIHFVECQKCGAQGPKADTKESAERVGNLRGEYPLKELQSILDNH